MVFKLKNMRIKTRLLLLILIFTFSAVSGVIGTSVVVITNIIPDSQFEIIENPIIDLIWNDLGDFEGYSYYDFDTGLVIDLSVQFDELERQIKFINDATGLQFDIEIRNIEIRYTNGSVIYEDFLETLRYYIYDDPSGNSTVYEVKVKNRLIWLDHSSHSFRIHYDPGDNPQILKRVQIFDTTTYGEEKLEEKGDYFQVTQRPILQWLIGLFGELMSIGIEIVYIGVPLLQIVALGAIAGLLTATFFTLFRLNRIFGGKHWTYFIIKRLRGKLGKLMSYVPIFDLSGTWYIEDAFVNTIDFSRTKTSIRELLKERMYDILFFPTALASILIYILLLGVPIEFKQEILMLSPLIAPVVLFLLMLYYPIVWSTDEGGLRKLKMSDQGDVISVKPIGAILRDGLSIAVGFSGLLALAGIAVDITTSFTFGAQGEAGKVDVAGFSLDLVGIILLVLWIFGLFFVLMASLTVGACILGISYLQNVHLNVIRFIRDKCEEDKVISNYGSVHTQFSPKSREIIVSIDE
ncbi:MAG: hypothetical protein ACXAEU_15560 [Candidatus Hodarchaeales archaeon]|jgi:hypothetical protein